MERMTSEDDAQFKRDLEKAGALADLINKPPHLWSDEEVAFAIRMMEQ
jgi:hypothetical protein